MTADISPGDEKREMETRLAYLENTLATLGDEFYTQQRELAELREKVSMLIGKLSATTDDAAQDHQIPQEKPPHY